ncbi:hypothetical protein EV586_105222 [Tumebacillus sp. BK434]|uniref:protein DpdG n=1 Tax=Tumebacillus sp. BK434 TaxID=2512169 RepID=UPI001045C88F|nr:protein DpdG [Tumebacillus sp. BK434]TCP53876.1 hypothetical protein EV586_105222 [Tumebacillus sp. BK434]
MSLLTQIYASPSRITAAYRLLLHTPGQRLPRSVMEQLLSPKSLAAYSPKEKVRTEEEEEPAEMVKHVLNELETLGVAQTEGDDMVLSPTLEVDLRNPQTGDQLFPLALTDLIFSNENDKNHDIAMLFAWYLTKDVLDAPSNWDECEAELLKQLKNDRLLLTNNARYGQFEDWICYCGLAWTYGFELNRTARLMPDPTRHIEYCLPRIFQEQNTLPIQEFMNRLAELSPVFEGGSFRKRLERDYEVGVLLDKRLSSVTSFTLHRLQDEGVLEFMHESDAPAMLVADDNGYRSITHITWHGQRG